MLILIGVHVSQHVLKKITHVGVSIFFRAVRPEFAQDQRVKQQRFECLLFCQQNTLDIFGKWK